VSSSHRRDRPSFPTRRSSDLVQVVVKADPLAQLPDRILGELAVELRLTEEHDLQKLALLGLEIGEQAQSFKSVERHCLALVEARSEEHTSELQSLRHLVCRLL